MSYLIKMPFHSFRFLAAAGCLLAAAGAASPAAAISRINSTGYDCEQLRGIVESQHAVIFRYPGTAASGPLYDRYVSDSNYCSAGYIAMDSWVPAKDKQCRLQNCQIYEPPFDR